MPVSLADPVPVESAVVRMVGPVSGIRPLARGTSGQSWLVTAARHTFVAKQFYKKSPLLLSPERQFELLGLLAREGIAPVPVGIDAEAGVLVTEFVPDAGPASAAALRDSQTIGRLVAVLERLHGLPAEIPAFEPLACARRYLDTIGGRDALGQQDAARYEELVGLASAFDPGRSAICHNDLVADNILLGDAVTLVDFDYSVASSPLLDLANLAEMNRFTEDQAAQLRRGYAADGAPYSREEFARVRRLVRLMTHFWSLASTSTGADIVEQFRIEDD